MNGYSKKFLAEHESEILLHKAAKKAFGDLGATKLPTIASLKMEADKLYTEKEALYIDYRRTKKEMNELIAAKQNVDKILNTFSQSEPEEKRNPQR